MWLRSFVEESEATQKNTHSHVKSKDKGGRGVACMGEDEGPAVLVT